MCGSLLLFPVLPSFLWRGVDGQLRLDSNIIATLNGLFISLVSFVRWLPLVRDFPSYYRKADKKKKKRKKKAGARVPSSVGFPLVTPFTFSDLSFRQPYQKKNKSITSGIPTTLDSFSYCCSYQRIPIYLGIIPRQHSYEITTFEPCAVHVVMLDNYFFFSS